MYTREQLEALITMANQLGFQDDVKHWTAELDKLDNESNDS